MSTVLECADCTTRYALDLKACPHCGSSNLVPEEGVATRRLPLFVVVRCACGTGPWTIRLEAKTSGLIELPTLACTSCGNRVPVTWPPEEEPMSPKITVHGGATNAREVAAPSPDALASQPLVGAEADQGRPLPEETPVVSEADTEALPDAEPDADPYAGMTLSELRTEAENRGIPSYGTKAQVAERLRDADV